MHKTQQQQSIQKTILFLFFIFIIAFAVRLVGIKYGEPMLVHPDEENVINSALYFSPKVGFQNVAFNRPAQIETLFTAMMMRLFSKISFNAPMWEVFYPNLFSFTLIGRLVVALLGSLIPIVAYYIGKAFKPDFSRIAALLFCFFPSFVLHSHVATPDIPLTLWIMTVLLFSIRYAKGGKEINLWLAVFFCAMSTADKYPGIISLYMVALAVLLRFLGEAKQSEKFNIKAFLLKGILCLFGFILALFMIAPLLFLRFRSVIDALIFEASGGHLGQEGFSYSLRVLAYLKFYFTNAGFLLSAFSIYGIYNFVRKKQKASWIISFSAFFLLCISVISIYHERWALPIYIGLLLCAAFGMQSLLELANKSTLGFRLSQATLAITFLLLVIAGTSQSLWLNLRDTRLSGHSYLESNGIRKEDCYYDGYTPFAPNFFPKDSTQDLSRKAEKEYAIFSSYYLRRFDGLDENDHEELKFFHEKQRDAELIWSVTAEDNPQTLSSQMRLIKYYLQSTILKQKVQRLYTGPDLYIYRTTPKE